MLHSQPLFPNTMSNTKPKKSSTTQVKTSQFTAHGMVDLWMDGQVMHYEATGPFNTELVNCLAVAQRDHLLTLSPQGAWVSMGTLRHSAMMSPEALARYAEIIAAPKPQNMNPIATAFVIGPDVEGGSIMAPLLAKVFTDIGRPVAIFATRAEAEAWALAQIARASA